MTILQEDDSARTGHALGGKPGRRKTRMKDPMPPSRRNLLSWIAGATAVVFGAGFARTLGGFKRSSQHLDEGGCDEHSKAAFGSIWAGAIVVTRSTAGSRTR
jgi:hypothetical protein